jgi:hypothetical protein
MARGFALLPQPFFDGLPRQRRRRLRGARGFFAQLVEKLMWQRDVKVMQCGSFGAMRFVNWA